MQDAVMRTSASVGCLMTESGTSSTRTSPAPYIWVARMRGSPIGRVVSQGRRAAPLHHGEGGRGDQGEGGDDGAHHGGPGGAEGGVEREAGDPGAGSGAEVERRDRET